MSVHGSINCSPLAWLGTFEHIYRYLITIPMYEKSGGSWLAALIMIQVKHRHISPWIMALCVMTSESLPVWLFNAWLDSWSTLQLNYLTPTSKCFVIENLPPHSLYPYIPEKKKLLSFIKYSSFSVFPFLSRVPSGCLGDNYAYSSGTWSKHQIWHGKMQEGKLKCQARKIWCRY